jgi:hypothetical protein
MIVRDGTQLSVVVEFPNGTPPSVAWSVRDGSGVIGSGTVTPAVDAVSHPITVSGALNSLSPGAFFEARDLQWSYTVASIVTNGEQRYSVEALLPVGISADGVRAKLGVSSIDLPDNDIALIRAFLTFRETATAVVMDASYDGALVDLKIRDAVEAMAARALIPTMQVRVASSEESGTNKYKRQAVDWEMIRASLDLMINEGLSAVVDGYDPTTDFGSLFLLAPQATDAITGA